MAVKHNATRAWWLLCLLWLGACQTTPDHHLIHPRERPSSVVTWADQETRGDLLIHLSWAKPDGCGPFPTVLVHPEGGKTVEEMQGVVWDLAGRGYVAVAADYQRRLDGEFRRNTFAWRSDDDVLASLDLISQYAFVDKMRIAALGFSQGGIYSLLIAAHAPERIRAVVAYYPVSDFNHWFDKHRPNLIERGVYGVIRWHFRRESGAEDEATFRQMLAYASPLPQAEAIQAPVLLIHGDRDQAADKEQSERLYQRLKALGKETELLIVPGAVHIFNFRQQELATLAWDRTLAWLGEKLSR